jgi:hypothetical protein
MRAYDNNARAIRLLKNGKNKDGRVSYQQINDLPY